MPKIIQKVAAPSGNQFNLSHNHVTTTDFKYLKPIFNMECVPGDKININNISTTVRLAPMEVPTFGNLRFIHRAFFVPYRLVFPAWENFLSGEYYKENGVTSLVEKLPYFFNLYLCNPFNADGDNASSWNEMVTLDYFVTNKLLDSASISNSAKTEADFTSEAWDIELFNNNFSTGKWFYAKWSAKGKRLMNLLLSFGYPKDFFVNPIYWEEFKPSYSESSYFRSKLNSLALLCYCKIFLDYLRSARFINVETYAFEDALTMAYHNSNKKNYGLIESSFIDAEMLLSIADLVSIYDSDFFTSLFTTSNAPSSLGPGTATIDPSTSDQVASDDNANFYYPNGDVNDSGLALLKSLSSFVRRRNLAGVRWVDQVLAHFGVRPEDTRIDRVEYLGDAVVPVQIGDITSTSDTFNPESLEGTLLADYAGKGFARGSAQFRYEAKEYGQLIVITQLVPDGSIVQGFEKHHLASNRLDFFTPEFDNMCMTPVSNGELYADDMRQKKLAVYGGNTLGVFGWANSYYWYKRMNDKLTGDFRFNSVNSQGGLDSYHMFRMLHRPDMNHPLTNVSSFSRMDDAEQYDRIFTTNARDLMNGENAVDHFYCYFQFNITAIREMKKLSDQLDIPGDGHSIEVEKFGTQL